MTVYERIEKIYDYWVKRNLFKKSDTYVSVAHVNWDGERADMGFYLSDWKHDDIKYDREKCKELKLVSEDNGKGWIFRYE